LGHSSEDAKMVAREIGVH